MGNTLGKMIDELSSQEKTRSEDREYLLKPHEMLRIGSVTRSIERHLGQAKEPKHKPPLRRVKSVDYLWDGHPERNWVQVSKEGVHYDRDSDLERPRVLNPHLPKGDDDKKGSTTSSHSHSQTPTRLCDTCLGITIENTTADAGYCHLLLADIYASASDCKLCKDIIYQLGLNPRKRCSSDRYRIVVSLELRSDLASMSQSLSGHYDASPAPWPGATIAFPSSLLFAITDYRPWEAPDFEPFLYKYTGLKPREYNVPEGSKPEVVVSGTFSVLTNEHDPAAEYGVGWVRDIGPDTASSRSFNIAAGWLEACLSCEPARRKTTWERQYNPQAEHPPVEAEHAWTLQEATAATRVDALLAEIPSRLIEIPPDSRRDGTVRLIKTKEVVDSNGGPPRFAALSYCWGQLKPGEGGSWRMTKANVDTYLRGIPRAALPLTLQDGIMVAEKLQIPYIWIDGLCIVQDDGDDWAKESAKMSGIYLGSVLTIAVASSSSVDEGCFNTNSQPTVKSAQFHEHWTAVSGTLEDGRRSCLHVSMKNSMIGSPFHMYSDEVLNSPLATRAWTLQEQILPRRTLYYTSKQLLWKCTHCIINEENFPQLQSQELQSQDLYPIMDFDAPLIPEAIDQLWCNGLVEHYSTRNLSFGSDKLVAISALAKATYLNRHVDYVAGLWKDCILSGTLWHRRSPGCKNKTYPCPSWSWASQDSAISYFWASKRPYYASTFTPKVVDISWKPDAANPFGNVTSACIYLDTRIGLGTVARDLFLGTPPRPEGNIGQSLVLSVPGSTNLWYAEAIMDDEGMSGGPVTIATMLGCRANAPVFLLLSPPDLDADEYRRVGIAKLDTTFLKADEAMTSVWKRTTIKIV